MMRQGVMLCVVCSLAMWWGKTVTISKDRRVILDLEERRWEQEEKIETEANKQLRTIPGYSEIERKQNIGKLLKHAFNNGHGKPGALPNSGFKPQTWPYSNQESNEKRKPTSQLTTAHPRWTHNPQEVEDIQAGIMTHFAVRPVNPRPRVKPEEDIDQIIHSLSFQHYPQLQTHKDDKYQTNFQISEQPQQSSYYPHHSVENIQTTSHGVRTTIKPNLTIPLYNTNKLVTWVPNQCQHILQLQVFTKQHLNLQC
jgi:hypothetical protein